jgi:thymidylate synthase ThyX
MTIRLITEPTVIVLADMRLDVAGMNDLLDWVQDYRPECVPDSLPLGGRDRAMSLFPHEGFRPDVREKLLTDNELLVELAGREYHAKMTFFLAGISRRVSHELIRHYVGADRSEEGSPSQESTRYTFHPGHFAVPPYVLERTSEPTSAGIEALTSFEIAMQQAYDTYLAFIEQEESAWESRHGEKPKAIDRKRIYECAAGFLPMQACTSMVWTTNPMALAKLFRERCDASADREFQRFATKWRGIAQARWPNLFPGSAA